MRVRRHHLTFLSCLTAVVALQSFAVPANAQTLQPLLQFKGVTNGGQPFSGLISDSNGNLYGTTTVGGNGLCSDHGDQFGCGTVYELSPPTTGSRWTETLLYQFQGSTDGKTPSGGLVMDGSGNLYGTTSGGGSSSAGTVFELSRPTSGTGPWTKTTIYNFDGLSSGSAPLAAPAIDNLGNLYGTTVGGGSTCGGNGVGCNGVVYKLSPPAVKGGSWTDETIYSFQGLPDGSGPESTLTFDGNGNLYGTTTFGGCYCGDKSGWGTVFELSPPTSKGGAWTEQVLYEFDGSYLNGFYPRSGVIFDSTGSLYGTAFGGGAVYKLTPPAQAGGAWTQSSIYSFSVNNVVGGIFGGVVLGKDGSLYGMNWDGGSYDWGSVVQLSPPAVSGDPWTETTLYSFNSPSYPTASLIFGPQGWLYGVTDGDGLCYTSSSGSHYSCGAVFRIRP